MISVCILDGTYKITARMIDIWRFPKMGVALGFSIKNHLFWGTTTYGNPLGLDSIYPVRSRWFGAMFSPSVGDKALAVVLPAHS